MFVLEQKKNKQIKNISKRKKLSRKLSKTFLKKCFFFSLTIGVASDDLKCFSLSSIFSRKELFLDKKAKLFGRGCLVQIKNIPDTFDSLRFDFE